jgi:hypothetical protein
MPQFHTIRSANIEVQYEGAANGFILQNRVRDCVDKLMPELERVMDAFGLDNEIISIDTLEFNVSLNGHDWEAQLIKQISESFSDKLTGKKKQQRDLAIIKTNKQRLESSLIFYLKHGHLPWNMQTRSIEAWRKEVMQLFNAGFNESLSVEILDLLKSNLESRKRLLREVSIEKILSGLQIQNPHYSNETRRLLEDMKKFLKATRQFVNKRFKGIIPEATFLGLLSGKRSEEEAFSQMFMGGLFGILNPLKQKEALSFKNAINDFLKETFSTKFFGSLQAHVGRLVVSGEFVKDDTWKKSNEALQGEVSKDDLFTSEKGNEHDVSEMANDRPEDMVDGIFISNAGIIILAPFLPMIFKNLGLWNGDALSPIDKAVCICGWLSSGNPKLHESELVLPKILCGLEPDMLVETGNFSVDEAMIKEANNLITSVIEYWSVLKNTSVDGIRSSFFLRNGKLEKKGRDWILRVEQQSYDMLLQQLPWNISMIKLPWMNRMIFSEWIY